MAHAIKTFRAPRIAKPDVKKALPLIIGALAIGGISFIGLMINMYFTTTGG